MKRRGNPEAIYPYRFDNLLPDEHRELSRRGGVASGIKRRDMAEARDVFNDSLILYGLQSETREHYREAIRRYAAEERRKRRRRKDKPDT